MLQLSSARGNVPGTQIVQDELRVGRHSRVDLGTVPFRLRSTIDPSALELGAAAEVKLQVFLTVQRRELSTGVSDGPRQSDFLEQGSGSCL